MDITRQKSGEFLVVKLVGRLDANWCSHVQNALSAAVKDGEHRIQLDMAGVTYVSSAGLRVLLTAYKQLKGIGGVFGVVRGSAAVLEVLDLAGMGMLIAQPVDAAAGAAGETGTARASASARFEVFALGGGGMRLNVVRDAPAAAPAKFGTGSVALGIGALGTGYADCATRFGEFLAVAGVAAFQPTDGSSQPDFVVSQEALVPEGRLLSGLSGDGAFALLARFEATAEARTIGLVELAQTALELSGGKVAVFVAVTETAGLVGAALRRSPVAAAGSNADPKRLERSGFQIGNPPGVANGENGPLDGVGLAAARFKFPEIRDWISFTSERAFRDSTSLLVGVVAQPGSALDPLLRPLGKNSGIVGHVHAAAFPYRPLRKGRIELPAAVAGLFDGLGLQAVLHLIADPRELSGAGQSEFFRGALWIAAAQTN